MDVLLVIVGAAIAFGIGWAVGQRGRRTDATGPRRDVDAADRTTATGQAVAEVLDEHPTGVVLTDTDGEVVYRNAVARSLIGTHVGVLLDEAVERHIVRALAGERSDETLELYGPPRTVLVVEARPISDGAAVFVEDISERRRSERVRTDFVANISHELKTPVGALSVLAETLEDETDRETIRRVVDRMQSEAARAIRTIDDLMELSRIELGGERIVEPISVDDIVAAAIERVEEMSARRSIGIARLDPVSVDGSRTGQVRITGDRRQLISAVGNLVENAVKYSSEGSAVQVRATHADGWVEIVVADQGVGIPQRDLDRIFERFYRVDRARSRATGGTGLGLSIVRHVATNHGGDVVVTSTEGEGSTFALRLPIGGPEIADGEDVVGSSDEGVA